MLMHKTTTVEHTGTLAQSHYTMLSGAIYTGPIVKDLLLYVAALQDLHFRGGLVNDLVVPDTKDPDVQRSHFTLSPNWIAGEHYDMDTSICFKIMPMSKDEFFLHINKLVSGSLGHCRPYSFDEE